MIFIEPDPDSTLSKVPDLTLSKGAERSPQEARVRLRLNDASARDDQLSAGDADEGDVEPLGAGR
jgi:hypothetical protein